MEDTLPSHALISIL